MFRQTILGLSVCCSWLWCGPPGLAHAQRTVTIVEQISTSGEVLATREGLVDVQTEDGRELSCRIQKAEEDTVALNGAVIRYPATVRVFGEIPSGELRRGMVVRFVGRMNRLAATDGPVTELEVVDEDTASLAIDIRQAGESPGDPATCLITAEVYSARNDRLVVTLPRNEYTPKRRAAFSLEGVATAAFATADYTKAGRGDRVERLVAARFDTGDVVIERLDIRLHSDAKTDDLVETDLGKYARYSDEPQPPRDVRSRFFILHTDISDRQARMLLDQLETMAVLVSAYYGRPPSRPIECYVVRDLNGWPLDRFPAEGLAKIREGAGVTISATLGNETRAVVYAVDDPGTVQHEAVHAYCAQTFGSTGPTWYSEGMAEMGNYWKKDQLAVDVPPVVITYLKNGRAKTLGEIVAPGQITGDSWQAYAWRWALCHLLANNPNYANRFTALGIGMMQRQPGVSFVAAYGGVAPQISFEYDFFVEHVDNGYRADLCAWDWSAKFRHLRAEQRAAAKIAARRGWQPGKINVRAGESYDYAALGTWKVSPDDETNADGEPTGRGRLEAVVMQNMELGEPIPLGARGSFTPKRDGTLYLRCRDTWTQLDDNSGEVTVHLRLTPQ